MKEIPIPLNGKTALGFEAALPKAPLVVAYGPGGFVMCGYLNVEAAEKLGVAAAMVRGVKTVEDLLNATVQAATTAARERGVRVGMTGKEALDRLV